MNKDEVQKLAKLARIEIGEAEAEKLSTEFGAILSYVGEIKGLKIENSKIENSSVRNVMRADADPHESGMYTEKLLAEAPSTKDGYVAVKNIL